MRTHRWSTREGTRGIRAHAHIYDKPDGTLYAELSAEAYWFSGARNTGLALSISDEAKIRAHIGLAHVLDIYLSAGSYPLIKRIPWLHQHLDDTTIAEITVHDSAIWWSFWTDYFGNNPRDLPRWRTGRIRPIDALLGKHVRTSEPVGEPEVVPVPMPEGCYVARVSFTRNTWKRPRWPFERTSTSYNIDVLSRPGPDGPYLPEADDQGNVPLGYIPVPGKGENAWDCGADGSFSMSGAGSTPEKAISALVHSTLRDRRRRAGDLSYADPI